VAVLLVRGAVRVVVLLVVGVIVIVGMCLPEVKVVYAALLGVERVQLVLRQVVDDAGAVRISHHVHRGAEAVAAFQQQHK